MNYNDFIQLVTQRHSCRAFEDRRVDRATLLMVLEAARLAPSACNRQPWSFLVADEEPALAVARRAYDREWMATAPAVIIALGHHDVAWHRGYDNKDATDIDLSIAIDHLTLAAQSLGLGTCWVCAFDKEVIARGFNLPPQVEPIALIPIGYPAGGDTPAKKRRSLEEIVKWGNY